MDQSRIKPAGRMLTLLVVTLIVAAGYVAVLGLPRTDAQSSETYTGCVSRATGQLRVNLKGDTCSPSEVRIELASDVPGAAGGVESAIQVRTTEPEALGGEIASVMFLDGSSIVYGDAIVWDSGTAQATLLEEGLYRIEFSLQFMASGGAGSYQGHVFINNFPVTPGVRIDVGESETTAVQLEGTLLHEATANDVVQVFFSRPFPVVLLEGSYLIITQLAGPDS